MKKLTFSLVIVVALAFSSCTFRLVDFTVISSKNVEIGASSAIGVQVKASSAYFLGIGWNIKDALDKALESGGADKDLLINGVVRYHSFPFVAVIEVSGTAVSSRTLKAELGNEGFDNLFKSHNVMPSDRFADQ